MIEYIDVYVCLAITLYEFIVNMIFIGYYERNSMRLSPREVEIHVESCKILQEKSRLNDVSSFVRVSKLQRSLDALAKESDLLKHKRVSEYEVPYLLGRVKTVLKPLGFIVIGILTYGNPVVVFESPTLIFPFGRIYSLPGTFYGSVSSIAFSTMVNHVCSRLIKQF